MEGLPYLAEARYLNGGEYHVFEWWLNPDGSVWTDGTSGTTGRHGIERSWNQSGRLRRGYPKYWVKGVRATKRQYLRPCANDPTLPRFRERDSRLQRELPAEIKVHRCRRELP
jgi:hypothetical protein